MISCPFCGTMCKPTREHLIPDWYIEASEKDHVTYNARSPIRHTSGSIRVKDVCSDCNNGPLSALDSYGHHLYLNLFRTPVFIGESSLAKFDYHLLVRWLLKVSYNSARINNSDTRILEKYRGYMLGKNTSPARVRIFVHAIAPTNYSGVVPVAATRDHAQVDRPQSFRISQCRLTRPNIFNVVQRRVSIDSYCFSIFVLDPDDENHDHEIEAVLTRHHEFYPQSMSLKEDGAITLTTHEELHAYSEFEDHFSHNAISYAMRNDDPDISAHIRGLVDGTYDSLVIQIPRQMIDENCPEWALNRLNPLVKSRDVALSSMQRVELRVDGFNDDPRELWEIASARRFLCQLFSGFPAFFLARPSGNIPLFANCFMTENNTDIRPFLDVGGTALNGVIDSLGLSDELNRSITKSIKMDLMGNR